jgi:hypothetical protein
VLCFAACATAIPAQTAGSGACGEQLSLELNRGTEVFAAPDDTSPVLTVIPGATPVCAGADSVGFGFHRVQLPNKSYGYVRDATLE